MSEGFKLAFQGKIVWWFLCRKLFKKNINNFLIKNFAITKKFSSFYTIVCNILMAMDSFVNRFFYAFIFLCVNFSNIFTNNFLNALFLNFNRIRLRFNNFNFFRLILNAGIVRVLRN